MILFETDFEQMTEAQLRDAALRFAIIFNETGHEEYLRLADETDEIRMRRMLAAPNPYENGDERVEGK